RRGQGRAWLAETLALGAAWLLLFGPAAEHATFALLAPFLAWALVQRWRWPAGRRAIEVAGVLILVLGWGALTRPLAGTVPLVHAALPAGEGAVPGGVGGGGGGGGRAAGPPPPTADRQT